MTISNTLTSTALPGLTPKPAAKPAAPSNPLATTPKATATPSLPTGLVGHNVNTTA